MKLPLRLQKSLFVVAVFIVGIVAVLPQTGWIVRLQLRGSVANSQVLQWATNPVEPSAQEKARIQSIADAHAGDFGMQLAVTSRQDVRPWQYDANSSRENSPSHRRAQRIWQLRERFPNEPALYATYLRLSCIHGGIGRDLEQEFLTTGTLEDAQAKIDKRLQGKHVPPPYWEANPDWVATLADAARTGERLDRGNAYFPLMLALCEFSQKQDTEALAALERAAACDRFNTYCATETAGMLALTKAEYGQTGMIARTAVAAAQLFPDLAALRSAARIATAKAILKEQNGDREGGLRIRRSVGRIGALMRRDGTSLIHSLVGIAVVQVSAGRPGGAVSLRDMDDYDIKSSDEKSRLSRERYQQYLVQNGHSDEASWFAEESRRGDAVKSISRRGLNESIYGGLTLVWVGVWWGICFVFLVTAFWMLLGGGIGALVARGARVRDAAPLHVAARYAIGAALVAPIISFVAFAVGGNESGLVAAVVVGMTLLGAPLIFLVRNPTGTGRELTRAQRRLEVKRSAKIYGKVLALTLVAVAAVGGTFPMIFTGVREAMSLFQMFSSSESTDNGPFLRVGWFVLGTGVFSLLGIVLTLLASLVWSLKRKVPASVGLALGFRAAALPVASLWLLLYAGAVVQTSRVEDRANHEMAKSQRHEGRYLAALLGETWPDLTPETTTTGKMKP